MLVLVCEDYLEILLISVDPQLGIKKLKKFPPKALSEILMLKFENKNCHAQPNKQATYWSFNEIKATFCNFKWALQNIVMNL
jgi:hypothetical protein